MNQNDKLNKRVSLQKETKQNTLCGKSVRHTCYLLMVSILDYAHVRIECGEGVCSHCRLGVGDGPQQRGLPSIWKPNLRMTNRWRWSSDTI